MSKIYWENLLNDLENLYLPQNLNKWKKVKCSILHGKRIYWYYLEDLENSKEFDYDVKEQKIYSGICIARPDTEISNKEQELEFDDCIVVVDTYPTEKCSPQVDFVALNKLIDGDVIEVYD